MLRNYITVALRNIRRHKAHTFINVIGLAVGMATCILIMLWVVDELSYDRFHQDADHIYRLCSELTMSGSTLRVPSGSNPMTPAIQSVCPEVTAITRILAESRTEIEYGDNRFFEDNIIYADSQFFSVFTFPLIQGDPQTALARAHSVVITRDIARKYFGDDDPLGKILRFRRNDEYTVTGVIERVPSNSHFSFDLVGSYRTLYFEERDDMLAWGNLDKYIYMRTTLDAVAEDLEAKVSSVIDERFGNRLKERDILLNVHLQPLTEIHLNYDFKYEGELDPQPGSITYILLFTAIAIGVLLIACANFINLTTAASSRRVREIGVRKTFGANHGRLTFQFLMESIILSMAALIVTIFLVELALPSFNKMIQRELEMEYLAHFWIIPGFVLFAAIVGVIAGIYPALSLSSMKPVEALKSACRMTESRSVLRRILVVGQYTISIALIIGSATIYDQVDFMKNKNLGFAKDQLLVVRDIDNLPQARAVSLRNEMAQTVGVVQASLSSAVPGGENLLALNFRPEGAVVEELLMVVMYADEFAQPTLGLELVAGRNFSSQLGGDSLDAVLINETAARQLGWDDAVGKTIKQITATPEGSVWKPGKVVGIIKDFHYLDLRRQVEPVAIVNHWTPMLRPVSFLSIRIETKDVSQTLGAIRDRWDRLSEGQPFNYFFVDDRFAEQYEAEERLVKIAASFSLLAIFVACLGLLGMASHAARRRTKEIGIRKVLGATTRGIATLLTTEFVKWVLIANIIAWPVAYYILNRWLQTFAYRTSINPGIFVLSAVVALAVAMATVAYQAIHAAHANPVDSLKYE